MSERIQRLKENIKIFPESPGVYLMKDAQDKIIYVGKAKKLRSRVRSYFVKSSDQSPKTIYLVGQIYNIDYVLTKTEVEAFLLEASLIKKHRPRYNIRLKDDKSYPYICCNIDHDFPRFFLSRKVQKGGGLYFGPYTSSFTVRETIRFINKTFKIRDCTETYMSSRKRPCMTHQIGRCTAPCVEGMITQKEYAKDVDGALAFLRGHNEKLLKEMTASMKQAALSERFEAAARFRDSMEAMKKIWERQVVVNANAQGDQDIIAVFGNDEGTLIETLHIRKGRVIGNRWNYIAKLNYQSESEDPREWLTSFMNQYYSENVVPDEIILPFDLGEDIYKLLKAVFLERVGFEPCFVHSINGDYKTLMNMAEKNAESHFNNYKQKVNQRMEGLKEIQRKLHLPELPQRIECYDISHFQGEGTVASQVVFEEGFPKKEDYRSYHIKSHAGIDDYLSMKEVLSRRLQHTEYDAPHLLVIDGGKGQLKMAMEVLTELKRSEIPVVGLAKARTESSFQDEAISQTEERFYLPGRQNPVLFRSSSAAFQILVGIRDEAHRFALSHHRKQRDQKTLKSWFDDIPGVGPQKKKALLQHFESFEVLRSQEVEDLVKVPGITSKVAEEILKKLKEDSSMNLSWSEKSEVEEES